VVYLIEWADAEATARGCTYTLFARFDLGPDQVTIANAGP